MFRRSLVPLVVLAPLALVGGLWLALGEWQPSSEVPAPRERPPRSPGEDAPPGEVPSRVGEGSSPSIGSSETGGAIDRDTPDPLERRVAVPGEFAEALWVEGTLVLPEDLPPDEVLQLQSRDSAFWDDPDGSHTYTCDVGLDGRFRVAYPPETQQGLLLLRARYLYLSPMVTIHPRDLSEDLVLVPSAGGRIVGRVLLPGGVERKAQMFDGAELLAQSLVGRKWMRRTAVAADGTFELTGVPICSRSTLGLLSRELVDLGASDFSVARFETTEIDLETVPGARVEGIVVDEQDSPQAGVRLALRTLVSDDYPGIPKGYETAKSSPDGTFAFRGLAPQEAHLRIRASGFEPVRLELGRLPEGGLVEGVRVQLSRGQSVRGVIEWPDGTPAAGAQIRVRERGPGDEFRGGRSQLVCSSADGSFLVTGLSAGDVQVRATAVRDAHGLGVEGKQAWRSAERIVDSDHELDLRLTLTAGDTLRGLIVDTAGNPVRSFTVIAQRDADASGGGYDQDIDEHFTSDQGTFELLHLSPGSWQLTAEAPGYELRSPVQAEVPSLATAMLVMLPGATVRGVVRTPSGEPVGGARVCASGQPDSTEYTVVETDRANLEGDFELAGIRARSITMHASARGWSDSEPIQLDLRPAEERAGLVLTLREPGRVTGEVNPERGRLAGRRIEVTGTIFDEKLETEAYTDGDGRFSLGGLPAGSFESKLVPLEGEDSSPRDTVAFDIRPGETTRVVLGSPPVRVRGRVTRSGEPVAACKVRIGSFDDPTITDAGGEYEQLVSEQGRLRVRLDPLEGGKISLRREVGPEPGQRLDFALPSASLSGVVLDERGHAAVGAGVWLMTTGDGSQGGSRESRRATADDQGRFLFEHCRAGRYRLVVWDGFPGKEIPHAEFHSGELELNEGQCLEDVVVSLSPAATLEGTASRADGTPVLGARIALRDAAGEIINREAASTDEYGRFVAERVPIGTLDVVAIRGNAESVPVRVVLAAGERVRVDLRFR